MGVAKKDDAGQQPRNGIEGVEGAVQPGGKAREQVIGRGPVQGRAEQDNENKIDQQSDIIQRIILQCNGAHMQAEQQTLGGGFIGIFLLQEASLLYVVAGSSETERSSSPVV